MDESRFSLTYPTNRRRRSIPDDSTNPDQTNNKRSRMRYVESEIKDPTHGEFSDITPETFDGRTDDYNENDNIRDTFLRRTEMKHVKTRFLSRYENQNIDDDTELNMAGPHSKRKRTTSEEL